MTSPPPQLMIEARRVLLDVLVALSEHRRSLVLVGAQAVYLRTAEVDLPFSASYTTDADLVVDPRTLGNHPPIGTVMQAAGFQRIVPDRPGIWGRSVSIDGREEIVPVDLIVPEALAGSGRRGARLVGHSKLDAGRAVGLEAALFDRSQMAIAALDPTDDRVIAVDVAGATALLISKLHKIGERVAAATARPDRLIAKDGADVYRLMLHLDPTEAVERLESLIASPVSSEVTGAALRYLDLLFAAPASAGVRLACTGLEGDVPRDRVEAVCVGFARTLLGRMR